MRLFRANFCLAVGLAFSQIGSPALATDVAAKVDSSQLSWVRDMVSQVLSLQPEVAKAASEARRAGYLLKEAEAARLPRIAVDGSYGVQNQTLVQQGRTNKFDGQQTLQIRVNQPLLDAVAKKRTSQSGALADGADWQLASVREQVMLRTIELYAEILRSSRLTELARENLRLHRQYIGQMKDIARSDLGRASDLLIVQSRVALAESVLTSRLAKLESARVQWRAFTTLPSPEEAPGAALAAVLKELPAVNLPESLDMAVEQAVASSAQIQKSLVDVRVAEAALGLVDARRMPTLGAEVRHQYGHNYGSIFGDQRDWYMGLNAQWRFSLGDRPAGKAAGESVLAARQAADAAVYRVRGLVESHWFDLQASAASLDSYRVYVDQAQAVVESYAEQFRIGRRSLLDVLNAENELFTARSNAVTTEIDLSLAAWRLLSSRGYLAAELGL